MSKRIVFKNIDGSCGVIIPVDLSFSIEEIAKRNVPEGLDYKIIDISDLPEDRYFRNAWEYEGTISINMSKARDIHMNKIRVLRDSKLKELDVPNISAISRGDKATALAIEAKKQVLRDIPQTFDLSVYTTPEDLKNAIPEELQ